MKSWEIFGKSWGNLVEILGKSCRNLGEILGKGRRKKCKRLTILPISKYGLIWFLFLFSFLKSFHGAISSSLMVFFSEKIIVGPQEAQYPQFLLQFPLTHYILRSIFFRTHSTPPICLKTQKCAILSTFSESGGKNHPKVGVRREKFNIGNCPQIFFRASYICWELTTKFS